jgi:hypothetical protein
VADYCSERPAQQRGVMPWAIAKRRIENGAKGKLFRLPPRLPKQLAAAAMSGSYPSRVAPIHRDGQPLQASARKTLQNPRTAAIDWGSSRGKQSQWGRAAPESAEATDSHPTRPPTRPAIKSCRSRSIRRTNTTLKVKGESAQAEQRAKSAKMTPRT